MPHPTAGYRNKANQRVPGTTTLIGRFKDSGGLLHWAFSQGQAAERGEIGSLYDKRDEAADAGTLAHMMVEAHIRGENPNAVLLKNSDAGEVRKLARQAFQSYLAWEAQSRIKIVDQEMSLVSEKYQYGGTPDAIGDIDGNLCLIDWKTSNSVYPDYLIQLSAYKNLIEECTDYRLTGGFHLIRFSKEHADFGHHYWAELDDAWRQFKLFRRAYDLDKRLKKRAK